MTKKPTLRQLEKRVIDAQMVYWNYTHRNTWDVAKAMQLADKRDKACAALAKARKK